MKYKIFATIVIFVLIISFGKNVLTNGDKVDSNREISEANTLDVTKNTSSFPQSNSAIQSFTHATPKTSDTMPEQDQTVQSTPQTIGGNVTKSQQLSDNSEANNDLPTPLPTGEIPAPAPFGPGNSSTVSNAGIDPGVLSVFSVARVAIDQEINSASLASTVDAPIETRRDSYKKAINDLQRMKSQTGEEAYDRYIYALGRSNRLVVANDSLVLAEDILKTGDIIYKYNGKRVFDQYDLNEIDSSNRNNQNTITIRRNNETFDVQLPKGILNLQFSSLRQNPDE